jgi:hypothetical protein
MACRVAELTGQHFTGRILLYYFDTKGAGRRPRFAATDDPVARFSETIQPRLCSMAR